MEIGDLSARQELRKKLRCKNFKWYLDNVYSSKYIPDENVIAYGRVCNNVLHLTLCLMIFYNLRCDLSPMCPTYASIISTKIPLLATISGFTIAMTLYRQIR